MKYFEQHGTTWEIRREIRRMVEFSEINFRHGHPRAILERAGGLLDQHGYLLLGGSETTTTLSASFEPVTLEGAVCFQPR